MSTGAGAAKPRFAVILYVNRSGSTLLSRLLSEASDDLFVFPELAFPLWLITRPGGGALAPRRLHDLIAADPRIDALPLAPDRLRRICEDPAASDPATLLIRIAEACAGRRPRAIVLKLERFAAHLDRLDSALDAPLLIHIVRDPRAVVSSMLRSPVPEKPGHDMARGDPLFAARHWRDYVERLATVHRARPVQTVRYEDLAAAPGHAIAAICAHLGVPGASRGASGRYRTSALDAALHPNVFAPVIPARAEAWREELAPRALRLVEHVCRNRMTALGYAPVTPPLRAADPLLIAAWRDHCAAALAHRLRSLALYLRRPDRSAAIRRRAGEAVAALRSTTKGK